MKHWKQVASHLSAEDLAAYRTGEWCGLPMRRLKYAMSDPTGRDLTHLTKMPSEPAQADFAKLSVAEYEALARSANFKPLTNAL